jgi:hypothetical protein
MRIGQIKFDRRRERDSVEDGEPRHGGCRGRHQGAGEVNERADRAAVVGEGGRFLARGIDRGRRSARRVDAQQRRGVARDRRTALEMHVPERERELDHQRKQREVGTPSRT